MKNLKLVFLSALVFTLVTVSCKNDDDDTTVEITNSMTINGEAFSVEAGFLTEFGENGDGSFDWDVTLLSDEFTVDINNEIITGTGSILYLDLNTNSATGLVPGTYTFSDQRAEFTWVDAEGATDFNFETDEGNFFLAESGTVTITGTGNNQLIVVDLVDENGNEITASYQGALQVF